MGFFRCRCGAISLIPRCPVGKLDGNCLLKWKSKVLECQTKSKVLIAQYHDKITCLQMLWTELQRFTWPFYHLYRKRGDYWVNILSEASTYKTLSSTELGQFNVTKWPKITQIKRLEQSFGPIFKYHCLWTCKTKRTQKNRQIILPIQAWAVVNPMSYEDNVFYNVILPIQRINYLLIPLSFWIL